MAETSAAETMSQRPIPVPDPSTAPYWQGARAGRLLLPRCLDCGQAHFYPKSICPFCRSARLDWLEAAGTGTVYSFTLVNRAPSPAFAGAVSTVETALPYAGWLGIPLGQLDLPASSRLVSCRSCPIGSSCLLHRYNDDCPRSSAYAAKRVDRGRQK